VRRHRSRGSSRRRPARRRPAVLVALVASLAIAAVALASQGDRHTEPGAPARPAHTPTPSRAGSAGKPVVPAPSRTPPRPIVRTVVGRGVRGAAIIRRRGVSGPQPAVILLHRWGLVAPSDYRRWIRHLAAAGNTVIAPSYQRDEHSRPDRALPDALAGIRAALRRVEAAPGTLVVAGHSAGAALATDYAASARAEGLPRALAVYAVYPGRAILGYPGGIPEIPPSRIPASTRIRALAGASDTVVGTAPAQQLVQAASHVPPARRRFVLVEDPRVDDHYAPTRTGAAARRTFWRPLDRLIASVRARPTRDPR